MLLIKDLPPASTVARADHAAADLLRRAVERLHPRADATAGVRLSVGAGRRGGVLVVRRAARGVPIGSFWRRLLFAFRFGSLNILLSSDLTDSTRILFHRDVRERARAGAAVPAVRSRSVHGDHQRRPARVDPRRVHGVRPVSVRAAARERHQLHAQQREGRRSTRTRARRAPTSRSPRDPMIRTLARIYPGLLQPLVRDAGGSARARALPGHSVRGAVVALRHVPHDRSRDVLSSRGSVADSRRDASGGGTTQGDAFMRHIVMRLPGERNPEFILMRPFTPRQKDNLAAWMVARNDGENYGKLACLPLPAAEPRVRADADREPHQSGHGGLAADLAVGSARVGGDPRRAARDSRSRSR